MTTTDWRGALTLVLSLSLASVAAAETVGARKELGVHLGSPLKLSGHASMLVPVGDDFVTMVGGVERVEGLELHAEAGIGGGRLGVGWGRRGTPYLHGWSLQIGMVRTWDSLDDPWGYPADHSLGSLSARMVTLGATVRAELLYDFDSSGERWGLGWSVGLLLW